MCVDQLMNLAIVTTIFNHQNNPYFLKNWNKFVSHLESQNLLSNLYVCEILPQQTSSMISNLEINHYLVHNNSLIWHKEKAINYLLSKLPTKYDGVIVIDNDVIPLNDEWYSTTQQLLENHIAVQPFDEIQYLLPNNLNIERIDYSLTKVCGSSRIMTEGNPGMIIGYRKDYLDSIGGLYDRAIVGGGDVINILPFFIHTHAIMPKIINIVCEDSVCDMWEYIKRARKTIEQLQATPITHINQSTIQHLYHGLWTHREYETRYSLLKDHLIEDVCIIDNNGFYEVIDVNLAQKLTKFFQNRLSLDAQDKPTIVTACKNHAENDHLLWLSPLNTIYFYNIDQLVLTLCRPHDVGNIDIVCNNTPIDTTPLLQEGEQTINLNNPEYIHIHCEKTIEAYPDIRPLGVFIKDIRIIPSTETELKTYSLFDVL